MMGAVNFPVVQPRRSPGGPVALAPVETASRGNDLHNHATASPSGSRDGGQSAPQPSVSPIETGSGSLRYDLWRAAPFVAQILGRMLPSGPADMSVGLGAYGKSGAQAPSGTQIDRRI